MLGVCLMRAEYKIEYEWFVIRFCCFNLASLASWRFKVVFDAIAAGWLLLFPMETFHFYLRRFGGKLGGSAEGAACHRQIAP